MKRTLHRMLTGVAALCLAACLPEERFWWSPTGDRAIVSIEDKLHLATADGELSPLPGDVSMKDALVKTVSWLPDGSGFVCQRVRVVAKWEELPGLIPVEEIRSVETMLPLIIPLLAAAASLGDQEKTLEDVISGLSEAQMARFAHAVRRKFEQEPERIGKLLLAMPKGDELAASFKKSGAGYEISELCVFKFGGEEIRETKSLVRSLLRPALMPRVSPKHDVLAFLRLDEDGESVALEVITLDGGAEQTVARNVAGAFDWMPDGRTLVFMAPIGGEGEKLHGIHRVTVIEENGKLMKPGEPLTLATAVTLNRPALQVLPDGRVLFASQPVTLPAVGTGSELAPRLYVVSADGKSVQPLPTAPGDLPTNLAYFVASPDGKHIAVVESETDAVAVVETDTGSTQIIASPHPKWQNRTLPAWKSATELTFAALHEGQPAWMLWSKTDGLRRLSSSWPAESTAKWLHEDKERK
jgi:hypothetical protein